MNKHTMIVIISSIVIAGTIIYSFLGTYGLNYIQIRGYQKEFDYTTMLTGKKIEMCNPIQIPININHIEITIFYQDRELGKMLSDGITLLPSKSEYIEGKIQFEQSENMFPMDLGLKSSENGIMKFDSEQIHVTTNYESRFLGIIPYSVSKNYNGFEFLDIMNQKQGNFSCN